MRVTPIHSSPEVSTHPAWHADSDPATPDPSIAWLEELEDNPPGPAMTLDQAEAHLARLQAKAKEPLVDALRLTYRSSVIRTIGFALMLAAGLVCAVFSFTVPWEDWTRILFVTCSGIEALVLFVSTYACNTAYRAWRDERHYMEQLAQGKLDAEPPRQYNDFYKWV
ncbi:hypothetical protein FNU76_12505 [Chitinimonas arctica]|uniref:Uncharacterized protein n=1 Tax=Chitinimonas arctica TaxID=2594795 RepID=A0A516SG22_9NEIS|nr:hypothetical protein [Chitinimonas arctica]QDQ27117.1 hypothetical protein FNU76_12505 [Chitinimonas arctica]